LKHSLVSCCNSYTAASLILFFSYLSLKGFRNIHRSIESTVVHTEWKQETNSVSEREKNFRWSITRIKTQWQSPYGV
jgi:hypothetical protein